jgi:hypothetical protein
LNVSQTASRTRRSARLRCAAEPGPSRILRTEWVPVLRSSLPDDASHRRDHAAPRPGHESGPHTRHVRFARRVNLSHLARLCRRANQWPLVARPARMRGASRSSRNVGRDAMDVLARLTSASMRTAKPCGPDPPDAGVKFVDDSTSDGGYKARYTGESAG